jgi:hypothetical protein
MAEEKKDEEKKDGDEGKAAESDALKKAEDALAAAQKDVEQWKGLSRKHEGQAKSNADAAKRLKDAEDAQKTAEQKLADSMKDLQDRLNATEARAMRAEVASAKGLTAAQAKYLQGSTQEEMEASADELVTSFKPADKDGEPDKGIDNGKPKEALRGGATSTDAAKDVTGAELLKQMPHGR